MHYKLTYFSIRGLAEPIRLMLSDNRINFEDHRINKDQWSTIKQNYHFGQIPCLHEDGEQIVQSGAIMRHLARKHELDGSNEMDTTYADMFAEGIRDLHTKYTKMIYLAYETEKEPFIKEILPVDLSRFEKLLAGRTGGKHYVLGEQMSYADYMLMEELDIMVILDPHCLDKFPLLKDYLKRMCERPNLKAWIEKRAADKVPVNGNGKQ